MGRAASYCDVVSDLNMQPEGEQEGEAAKAPAARWVPPCRHTDHLA